MILLKILWNFTQLFLYFIPVFSLFFFSWMFGYPKRAINANNPIWHISLIFQHLIYLNESRTYTRYKHVLLFMFVIERVIYVIVYNKYANVHERILNLQKYYSLLVNVIPYSVSNFLIAIPFFVFYSNQATPDKTSDILFYLGFAVYALAVIIAIYKFLHILIKRPSATNLNAIILSDVVSMIGLFIINSSLGKFATIICAFINYVSIRVSLGRSIFYKGKDFIPKDINVIPKIIIK